MKIPFKKTLLTLCLTALYLPAHAEESTTTLEEVTVTSSKNKNKKADDPDAYKATNASTATKTDTPIMETPFSVQVVPQQIMKDQQVITLQEATKNISGVQTNFGYGGLYQAFAIRGFETNNILRNGQRAAGGVGRSMVEMANVESVEVLKGPAAMIYGRLDPGGMVNVITKKPLDTEYYSLQQQFGSNNLFRTTLDATGALDKAKTLLYRLDYSYFDTNSFQSNSPHGRSHFLAPSLTWRPNDKFEANLNFEYRNAHPLGGNGVPAIGNRPSNVPITNYLGGTAADYVNVDREVIDFKWSYKFNEQWKVSSGVTATFDNVDFAEFFGASYDATFAPLDITSQQGMGLVPWYGKRRSKGFNTFLDLTGEFNTFGIQHKVLLGGDHYLLDYVDRGITNGFAPVAYQNIYNPTQITWEAGNSLAQVGQLVPDWTFAGKAQWFGVYIQDQLKIMDKLHVLLGGRYDHAITNGGMILSPVDSLNRQTVKDEKFSPRIGLIYQATPWLSVYGNYVESLGNSGNMGPVSLDANGLPLHAQRSTSYETGLKFEAFDKRLLSTLAFFEIDKSHMATRDLSSPNPNAMNNSGAVRSRGFEWDMSGAITDQLNVIASYAYTNARYTSNGSGLQGNLLANVPKHSGSIWAKYQILPERLSIGVGGLVRSKRQGDDRNTFTMPGYATMDTFIAYHFKPMEHAKITAQLNVNNILDKHYFINSNNYDSDPRLGVMPGQPLTVLGSIRVEY